MAERGPAQGCLGAAQGHPAGLPGAPAIILVAACSQVWDAREGSMASMLRGEDAHSRPGTWAGGGHTVLCPLPCGRRSPDAPPSSPGGRTGSQGRIGQHCTEVLRTLFSHETILCLNREGSQAMFMRRPGFSVFLVSPDGQGLLGEGPEVTPRCPFSAEGPHQAGPLEGARCSPRLWPRSRRGGPLGLQGRFREVLRWLLCRQPSAAPGDRVGQGRACRGPAPPEDRHPGWEAFRSGGASTSRSGVTRCPLFSLKTGPSTQPNVRNKASY